MVRRGGHESGDAPRGHDLHRVSDDGLVIVGESECVTGTCAFRWTSVGGMENLGVAPGHSWSGAYGVSGDGAVVVGGGGDPTSGALATLWTGSLGMVDLNTYLPTLGIDLTGWRLRYAQGISPDGRTIVGDGIHNGAPEGWVAVLGLACYANCDRSTGVPALSVQDFACFLNRFAGGDSYANCDGSTAAPVLNVSDFLCFLNAFAAGCS
jgi:hypothetical protein